MSLYVFHPLTLIPILARWNSNSKESQTLGLLAVDENLLFLEYVCNCKAKVGFVSTCKMTKTEWVDSWKQPRCYSQWHRKWHLPAILWCRSQISNKGTQATSHLRLLLACLDHRLAKIVGKSFLKDGFSTGPRSNPLFDRTKGFKSHKSVKTRKC